jgi:hypothetical protein
MSYSTLHNFAFMLGKEGPFRRMHLSFIFHPTRKSGVRPEYRLFSQHAGEFFLGLAIAFSWRSPHLSLAILLSLIPCSESGGMRQDNKLNRRLLVGYLPDPAEANLNMNKNLASTSTGWYSCH